MNEKTIAAIATAQGAGGIGIIRISGCDALEISQKVFKSITGRNISEMKGYTAAYGHIYDGDELIDSGVLLVYLAPQPLYLRFRVVLPYAQQNEEPSPACADAFPLDIDLRFPYALYHCSHGFSPFDSLSFSRCASLVRSAARSTDRSFGRLPCVVHSINCSLGRLLAGGSPRVGLRAGLMAGLSASLQQSIRRSRL